jgi:branched-subunit amino acid aminotransferase/4-amino-4-deoxychorismate lyase
VSTGRPGEGGAEGLHRLGFGLDRRSILLLDLALLLDVEAQVLEQRHLARLQGSARLLHLGPHAVIEELDGLAEELREPVRHRLQRVLGVVALPVRAAEMAHEHEVSALVEHVLDGGE